MDSLSFYHVNIQTQEKTETQRVTRMDEGGNDERSQLGISYNVIRYYKWFEIWSEKKKDEIEKRIGMMAFLLIYIHRMDVCRWRVRSKTSVPHMEHFRKGHALLSPKPPFRP